MVVGDVAGAGHAGHVHTPKHLPAHVFHNRAANRDEGACYGRHGRLQQGTGMQDVML